MAVLKRDKKMRKGYVAMALLVMIAMMVGSVTGLEEEGGVLNNLIEMDQQLFEELVAGPDETKVKHGQTWLILFDSPVC